MSQKTDKEAFIPGLIGNFNIPKSVIENKVDVLTFLELLVRKGIITAHELDDVRASVVAHLNAIYPELELAYATPESMGQQAGLGGSALPPQPKAATSQSSAAAAFSRPMATNSAATFKPSEAAQAFMAPKDQTGFMASSQVTPGETSESASKAEPAPAQEAAPAAAPVNKPLWVQAPPPKFIK